MQFIRFALGRAWRVGAFGGRKAGAGERLAPGFSVRRYLTL
jgi:hypothetical protein